MIPSHDFQQDNVLQCHIQGPLLSWFSLPSLHWITQCYQLAGIIFIFVFFQNGKTALHFAAHKGQLLAVKALIEAGADLDITDEVWGTFK